MNLNGKRILITRPRAQAQEFANALIAHGAIPIFFPVIEIIPPADYSKLDDTLQNLERYDWLIFTSIHSVDAFFQRLGVNKLPSHLHMAVVGSKTSQALSAYGVKADHMPDEYISEGLFSGLNENIAGKQFLLPQSDLVNHSLGDQIRQTGGIVTEVIAYQNVIAAVDPSGLEALRSGVDVVTFTSPSTVRNFIQLVRENGLDPFDLPGQPIFACIGPVTQKAAQEVGLDELIVAKEYTTDGLVTLIGDLVHS